LSVRAEALAVEALLSWLRLKLPAKVAEVNAARAPRIYAATAGDYTVPVGASLKVNLTGKDSAYTTVALTDGVRTAAQVAAEVNAGITGLGGSAAADTDLGNFYVAGAAPSSSAAGLYIGPDTTGANALFGWDAGGEHVIVPRLVAPGHRNVMDGWPQQLDAQAQGFIVVVGRRVTLPVEPSERRDEHDVMLEVALFRPATQQENHRSRESIAACAQCVREVLKTDAGLQLGRARTGDIVKVQVGKVQVEAMRFQQMQRGKPFGPAFDSAAMTLYVKTFERPAAS
jgi:hypothetical protein